MTSSDIDTHALEGTLSDGTDTEDRTPAETGCNEPSLPLRLLAEFAGTFLICFAIYAICTFGSIIFSLNLAYVAIGTGLAYAVVAFVFGGVCGGHFNPAITVAAMLTGKTRVLEGLLAIIMQTIGAILVGLLIRFLLPVSSNVPIKQWLTTAVNGFDKGSVSFATINQYGLSFSVGQALAVEILASVIVVAVAMRAYGTKRYAPALGLAYALGTAITFPVTATGLNPARTTGIALAAFNANLDQNPLQQLWLFWVCPVLAAAVVALALSLPQLAMPSMSKPAKSANDSEPTDRDAAPDMPAETISDEAAGGHSQDQVDAQVGEQQPDAQTDADKGIERD